MKKAYEYSFVLSAKSIVSHMIQILLSQKISHEAMVSIFFKNIHCMSTMRVKTFAMYCIIIR
jgi:hypothetical protein